VAWRSDFLADLRSTCARSARQLFALAPINPPKVREISCQEVFLLGAQNVCVMCMRVRTYVTVLSRRRVRLPGKDQGVPRKAALRMAAEESEERQTRVAQKSLQFASAILLILLG